MGIFSGGPSKHYTLPSQYDLYSGPRAFSGHQTDASKVQDDPSVRQSMNTMGNIARTGWTANDRQAQAASQRQANLAEQSQRQGVEQQARMRGQGGGGAMLAGALAAQQGGANRAQGYAADLQQRGQDRRMQATQAQGQMGMGLTQQRIQQAGSNDAFNQWASGQQGAAVQQSFQNKFDEYRGNMEDYNHATGLLAGIF